MTAPALRVRPASMCPAHPDCELIAVGGGARGVCPADGASHQMSAPEVAFTVAGPAYACCGNMSSGPGTCRTCGQPMRPVRAVKAAA